MAEYKDGVLLWWSRNGHCGVVFEEATQERFFLHQARIIAGPAVPKIDDKVRFEVDPLPPRAGKLRIAINVVLLPAQPQAEKVEPQAGV